MVFVSRSAPGLFPGKFTREYWNQRTREMLLCTALIVVIIDRLGSVQSMFRDASFLKAFLKLIKQRRVEFIQRRI